MGRLRRDWGRKTSRRRKTSVCLLFAAPFVSSFLSIFESLLWASLSLIFAYALLCRLPSPLAFFPPFSPRLALRSRLSHRFSYRIHSVSNPPFSVQNIIPRTPTPTTFSFLSSLPPPPPTVQYWLKAYPTSLSLPPSPSPLRRFPTKL